MKLKKVIPILFFCSISILRIYGQTTDSIKPLTIGDTVPDLLFDTIINSSLTSVKLSDFEGKLIILDLWSPSCGSCIADMPRKEKLQQKFGNKIAILPIAYLDKKFDEEIVREWKYLTIPNFWKNNPITNKLTLPTILDKELILVKNFSVPGPGLQIWIDSNKVIRGLSTEEYVNEIEINKILNQKTSIRTIWQRNKIDYNLSIINAMEGFSDKSRVYYSLLTPHMNYIQSYNTFYQDSIASVKTYKGFNVSILNLYSFCFTKYGGVNPFANRFIIQTKDSSKFFQREQYYEGWWSTSTYCFEKITPINIPDSMFAFQMKEELDHYLKFDSYIKTVPTKCLIIKRVREISSAENENIKNKAKYSCSFAEFVNDWNSNSPEILPIVYDQKLKEVILWLPAMNWKNSNVIKKELSLNGFLVEENIRKIPMIVIQDKK